ncbi:MAG: META domain-containing protein [Geminicoccales bacterium]
MMWLSHQRQTAYAGTTRRLSSLISKRLLTLIIPWLAITACAAQEATVEGTWQLETVDSVHVDAVSEDNLPSFTIAGSTIEGFDGCNSFFGPIDRPGEISATRRACPATTLTLPMDLNALDTHFSIAEIDGDILSIPAQGNYPASTYRRRDEKDS